MRRLVLLCLLSAGVVRAAPAGALDWSRLQTLSVPVGGTITLRGALRSSYDGSVVDAASTRFGDGRLQAGGWLDFEAGGLRLVAQDRDQHRYEFAPLAQPGWACVQAQLPSPCLVPRLLPLAQARLLTVDDFRATLSGELGMDGPVSSEPVRLPWVVLPVGAGVAYLLSRRIRARRQGALYRQAKRLIRSLGRRLQQGDPVHQRLLAPLDVLAGDSKRLERERRRGLAEGWPGEAARAEASLREVVTSLRGLHRSLDGAARLGRGRPAAGLLVELDQGIAVAAAAARELDPEGSGKAADPSMVGGGRR